MAKQYETRQVNPAGDHYNLVPAKSEVDEAKKQRRFWGWTFILSTAINAAVIYNMPEHFYTPSNILHSGINETIVLIHILSILLPLRSWDTLGFKIKDLNLSNTKKQ